MKNLIEELKKTMLYSEELEIKLKKKNDEELFKWFLASILYGGHISEKIAKNTYFAFKKYNLLTPQKILDAGWEFLVYPIMREGGYVRYDGKKSDQILKDCQFLIEKYEGSLNRLHELAKNSKDLEDKIDEFYGIGPITVNIFLRELRPYWEKADPKPLAIVYKKAEELGIDLEKYNRKSIEFVRIEAGIIRLIHKKKALQQ